MSGILSDEAARNERYWMFFSGIDGLGDAAMDRMLERFETAEEIFKAGEEELHSVPGVHPETADRIITARRGRDVEEEYERVMRSGIGYVSRQHPDYPTRLAAIGNAPNGLFFKGSLPQNGRPAIAVVGSRKCSEYGRAVALRFAKELAAAGVDIISGMAAGIDGYAHRGALNAGGTTYAVLGCGADKCYPASNRDIYARIPQQGGVLSEYYPQTAALPINFPRRNRIISALSDGILVVEARHKSGTLITVDMGLEQGKDIYAVPGRIGDELSCGCNNLIRQGARLVTEPADILAELAPHYGFLVDRKGCADPGSRENKIPRGLTSDQIGVLKRLGPTPKTMGELAMATGLDAAELLAALTMLELRGLARPIGNGAYVGI